MAQQETDELAALEKQYQAVKYWLLLLLVVIAGGTAGFMISKAAAPTPKIGVVRLYNVIDYGTAPFYLEPLQIAAERRDIKGVVVLVDSPGGDATVSEELYYTILGLRQNKPVVASIERFGASGAYYAAVAANYIVARPAAQVGSIGVVAGFPEEFRPDDEILTTGPFKGSGQSQVDFIRDVEAIKETFLTHVYDQRSYALEYMHSDSRLDVLPERDMLGTGQIWTGSRAYEIGLVDLLGSNQDAIRKAAELAGVTHYDVIDLLALAVGENEDFRGYSVDPDMDWYETGPWAEMYHLYVVPEE